MNITNIELFAKSIASESAIFTNLQKLLFEISIVYEFSSISSERSYQMLKNRSITSRFESSSSFVSFSRISKS